MDKITIAGKQFTLKFPSFKRTQRVTELMSNIEEVNKDWAKAKEVLQVMVEEDVNVLDENYENDTIGIGDIIAVQNAFFQSTVKTVLK